MYVSVYIYIIINIKVYHKTFSQFRTNYSWFQTLVSIKIIFIFHPNPNPNAHLIPTQTHKKGLSFTPTVLKIYCFLAP